MNKRNHRIKQSSTNRRWLVGMVSLEFACMLPFVFVLFLFAFDVIFLFNYQILGSYAAFAAARSYAVYQDQPLARDVATAIMSSATVPISGVDPMNGELEPAEPVEGVKQFVDALRNLSADYSSRSTEKQKEKASPSPEKINELPNPFTAARGRMSFSIKPDGFDKLSMRPGYTYGEKNPSSSEPGSVWDQILSFFGVGKEGEKESEPAKIVQVQLWYRYPILMGYLRKPSFVVPEGGVRLPASITMYNSCASPIEPVAAGSEKFEQEDNNSALTMTPEDDGELEKAKQKIDAQLDAVYSYICRVAEEFNEEEELLSAFDYEWEIVSPGNVGIPYGIYASGMRKSDVMDVDPWWPHYIEQKLPRLPTHMRRLSFINIDPPMLKGEFKEFVEKGSPILINRLPHVLYTLELDISYREHVIQKIDDEIRLLESDVTRLTSMQRAIENLIDNPYEEYEDGTNNKTKRESYIKKFRDAADNLNRAQGELQQSYQKVRSHNLRTGLEAFNRDLNRLQNDISIRIEYWKIRLEDQNKRQEKVKELLVEGYGEKIRNKLKYSAHCSAVQAISSVFTSEVDLKRYDGLWGNVNEALSAYYELVKEIGEKNTSKMGEIIKDMKGGYP